MKTYYQNLIIRNLGIFILITVFQIEGMAQLPWSPAQSSYTLDIEPQFPPVPGTVYTWTIPTLTQPLVGHNPAPVVLNAGGNLVVNVTAVDLQGNTISYNQSVLITEPAFPIAVTAQNGLSVTVQAQFPLVPNFQYLLSFNGGITTTPMAPNGTAVITVPQFGTYDLCISVYSPLGNLMGIPTCIPLEVFEFCPSPMFQTFILTAPDSVHCGSPGGICVTPAGGADADMYCMDIDWGDGQTSENVSMGLCPFHWYECDGFYDVVITIYCCDNPNGIPVVINHFLQVWCHCLAPPAAAFSMIGASGTDDGCDHVGVCLWLEDGYTFDQFTDYCVSYDWGDGTPPQGSYVGQCPIEHVYACNGTYDITATIYCCDDPCTSTTVQTSVTVSCVCDVDIDVSAFVTSVEGCNVNMSFYGGCEDYCKSWDWGDGSTSSGNDVSHSYGASGTYMVELTVYCCNNPSSFQKFYQEVTVSCPCNLATLNNFPQGNVLLFNGEGPTCAAVVATLDLPDGIDANTYCIRWLWGDGSTPSETGLDQSAVHVYGENGTYNVCARVFCCDYPMQSVLVDCQEVSISCQPTLQCEVYGSFYTTPLADGQTAFHTTSQVPEGASVDSVLYQVYDASQELLVSQLHSVDDTVIWLTLPNDTYSAVQTTYASAGGATCIAIVAQEVVVDLPVCTIYPSHYSSAENGATFIYNTSSAGEGTSIDSIQYQIYDVSQQLIANQMIWDIPWPYPAPSIGTYQVVQTVYGSLGNTTCSASVTQDLVVNHPTCTIYPSHYSSAENGATFIYNTSSAGEGTSIDSIQYQIYDVSQELIANQMIWDIPWPYPAPSIGTYQVVQTVYGSLGNTTCSASVTQDLVVNHPSCTIYPSHYSSAENGATFIYNTSSAGEGTSIDSIQYQIYDVSQELIANQMIWDIPWPYPAPSIGTYQVVQTVYGSLGNTTCSASVTQDLVVDHPVCAVYPALSIFHDPEQYPQEGEIFMPVIAYGPGTQEGSQVVEVTDALGSVVQLLNYPNGGIGPFSLDMLPPGEYTVTLEAQGIFGMPGCSATASIPFVVPVSCPADLDGNLIVNITDLLIMISGYGTTCN